MIHSDERTAQCTAVEVLAGIIRSFNSFDGVEVLLMPIEDLISFV
jgi:hypothetical protein